jgi:hypothetical protein
LTSGIALTDEQKKIIASRQDEFASVVARDLSLSKVAVKREFKRLELEQTTK